MTPYAAHALVARQPIFDVRREVVAYELLYRDGAGASMGPDVDGAMATARVLQSAVFDIGIAGLVGEMTVHINVPEPILRERVPIPLPAKQTVIEVLEGTHATPDVIEGIAWFRSQGYLIALDDFADTPTDWALVDHADMIKVDLTRLDATALASLTARLRTLGKRLVAEKVETLEEFERCCALGFDLFQGYFLQRPETFFGQRIPTDRLTTLRLLAEVYKPEVSLATIESALAQDAALSYRLLRCVNSSYFNLPHRIESLRRAITTLGLDAIGRLCAVLALAGFDDRPEIVRNSALVRARMCELLAIRSGRRAAGSYFLVGHLSMLDTLVGAPMHELMILLPLQDDIVRALIAGEGDLGAALRCTQAYERGDWQQALFPGLDAADIGETYREAVKWADAGLAGLGGPHIDMDSTSTSRIRSE